MASYFSAPGGELWVKDLLSFENKNIEIVEAKIDWCFGALPPFFFVFCFAPKFGKPSFQNLEADDRPKQSKREDAEKHRVSDVTKTRAPRARAATPPQPYFKKTPIKKLTMALPSRKNPERASS